MNAEMIECKTPDRARQIESLWIRSILDAYPASEVLVEPTSVHTLTSIWNVDRPIAFSIRIRNFVTVVSPENHQQSDRPKTENPATTAGRLARAWAWCFRR